MSFTAMSFSSDILQRYNYGPAMTRVQNFRARKRRVTMEGD
jgi:hypothetical protein